MESVKYWIAVKRDGTETLVRTYTSRSEVYNADGTYAKQITEAESKAWKAKVKKESKRKKNN
jgi:hypothetical protein